ncbi:putative fungistatic metabolite [Chaetomidium leptoderma]|uniref:Fungistatic metabolite n=1 Tax=Chaetomidium leptoderma TaxID=669021 RepID=A0AAN6VW11_9PEZI|nr:putative fungistatic metabolite [Chaetomidium leptoderma]
MKTSPSRTLFSSLLLSSLPLSLAQLAVPAELPGAWEYEGCYVDVPGRTINGASYADGADMTIEACLAFCTSKGFAYAGTEYSVECFCGSGLAATADKVADSVCNMPCSGDATQPCGAGSRLSIFHTTEVSGPQVNPGVNDYNYLGCYSEGTTGRALTYGAGGIPAAEMTVAKCTAACRAANYILAGVEFGGECYCGNTIANGGAIATSGCNMLCNGDSSEFCGGGNRLNVYNYQNQYDPAATSTATPAPSGGGANPAGPSQPETVGNYEWHGCRTEATGTRALSAATFASDEMTLEACQAFCSAYTYFGVEYARECFCGNTFNTGSVLAPATDCSMPCAGSPSQYCGAGNRLSVYAKDGTAPPLSTTTAADPTSTSPPPVVTGVPGGWTYQGCWIDGKQGRILPYQVTDSQTNSQAACANACAAAGYSISGTEYAVQCFCGKAIYNGGVKTAESDCSTSCPGAPSQKCGAGDRMSIVAKGTPDIYAPPAPQPSVGSWAYQGCAEDNINDKRTFFWQLFFPGVMTPKMCLDRCAQYGYHAAGLEYGEECYCGDPANMATHGATFRPETECNIVCAGNASAICGGLARLTTYFWTGPALYSWDFPQDSRAGEYRFLVDGVNIPLITQETITGKVSFISKGATGPGNETGAYELDLATLTFRTLHIKTDVFCAAGVTLPDKAGRQLNIGGWAGDATYGTRLYWPDGSPGVPGTHDWQENVNVLKLQAGRWYPSAMIMSNGSVMVIGGSIGSNDAATPSIEILPFTGQTPLYMDWLDRTHPNNLYPFLCVLPGGGIFVQYWNEARILDPVTFATIKTLPNAPGAVNDDKGGRTYPLEGAAVLLPQKYPYTANLGFLVCGGSTEGPGWAIDNCVSTYPEDANPKWEIERMPSFRVMSCMAPLPDGTYLIVNGALHGVAGFGLGVGPNLNALLYDPEKPLGKRITVAANTTIARMYHSEAITLLDGRVLISGSNPEDGVNPEEYRVEVFVPPYLLNGKPRPTFTIANKDWAWGQTNIPFTLGHAAQNGGGITATLLGAVSSTHGNSMGARTLIPKVTCTGGTSCTIDAPPNANICPPGWYQLFVLDGGVPAVGVYVRIGGDPGKLGNWPQGPDFTTPGI